MNCSTQLIYSYGCVPVLVNKSESISAYIYLQCFFKHGKSYLEFYDVFKKFVESLKCILLRWNDKYLSALIGVMFNDLALNKYALSITQCES